MSAAHEGHVEVVKRLLRAGAAVNQRNQVLAISGSVVAYVCFLVC